jgi:F-type H+-transporting ATPase subunit gamma
MATFKDIKKRINTVKSTQKTTSAMKMVASSKLRKAENMISNMHPYSEELLSILKSLLTTEYSNPLSHERPIQNVAIVVFSSDSSLCGAFNTNTSQRLRKTIEKYRETLSTDHIFVYTVGKKVYENIKKTGISITKNFENLAGKSHYKPMADLATALMAQFEKQQIDRVELIYHHYKSVGTQELVNNWLLPIKLPVQEKKSSRYADYILEPSGDKLLQTLIPQCIKLKLYTALLDSNASEHAARMIAMQTATENANGLVGKLTIQYNKSRQQAITNELLDLVGGSAK